MTCCVSMGKLLHLSESHVLQLEKDSDNDAFLVGLL